MMNLSSKAFSLVLAMAAGSPTAFAMDGLPPHHPPVRGQLQQDHPMHPTLARFSSQFRCPYAKEWLTKGAHKAAIDLGLATPEKIEAFERNADNQSDHQERRKRHLQQTAAAAEMKGSCSFASQWSGPSCLEFRGTGWTDESMTQRCAAEADSVLSPGAGCPAPDELAGWCITDTGNNAIEASSMMVSAMSDCDGNKMACETFVGGAFEAAPGCEGGASDAPQAAPGGGTDFASMGPPMGGAGGTKCMIAPGAIGAAHQAGYSDGYTNACPGTPAEGSPYMWPMAWSADVDTQSLAFGYDEVVHRTNGRVFYRLDKNWKRSDTLYTKGVRRGIGQGPCDNIDESQSQEGVLACITDMDVSAGDAMETMIHRGGLMYFITWKNTTDVEVGEKDPSLIAECMHMNLAVIGNVRPDWYMDDLGDDTDVQYLGDQHVYYASDVPRLAKQWRKKDFASQYFTMSVSGNPPNNSTDDAVRWPLVLNIPGEGFGDDMLQSYANHALLTDDDDDLFDLVQNLEAMGGSCPLLSSGMGPDGTDGGQASVGPPTLEVHVPSNLEVDPNSWVSSVYTFSPVWQPPMKVDTNMNANAAGVAVTEEGRIRVESCYDPAAGAVFMNIEFRDIEGIQTDTGLRLPWMSIGYRDSDVCAMTPANGGDTSILMIAQSPSEMAPKAYAGSMGPAVKRFDQTAIGSIYDSFWPLESTVGYSNVALLAPMLESTGTDTIAIQRSTANTNAKSVYLSFHQTVEAKPDVMHLMYAIGMSPQIGMHTTRSCFEIEEFPTCSSSTTNEDSSTGSFVSPPVAPEEVFISETSEQETSRSSHVVATAATVLGAVVAPLALAL